MTDTASTDTVTWGERAGLVATIAAEHADAVDAEARFPREAVDALRDTGLLAAGVPSSLGGGSASVAELGEVARILGEACSATAMIFAMHQIQVVCLVRHGLSGAAAERGAVTETLRRVVGGGWLLASATTEAGIGGNTRTSGCAVDEDPGRGIVVSKTAPVISYGNHADAYLVTARRTPDSPPSDQVLVICDRTSTELTQLSEWNTLGFRGTCSPGFQLEARVPRENVLETEFARISSETMLPVSHVLWASVWLGIATAATDRATTAVQRAARKAVGQQLPGANRLAELLGALAAFEGVVRDARCTFDALESDTVALTTVAQTIAFNSLKIKASDAVIDIVSKAMLVTGIAGYRVDSDLSLGRQLRDSYGTAVMVNNDRILSNNAQLALIQRRKGKKQWGNP